jgi:hypothetical protein
MTALSEEYKSAKFLRAALADVKVALEMPYTQLPDDPKLEFFNAAVNMAFLFKCVMIEMINDDINQLVGTGAIRLAISLGDLASTRALLVEELDDIRKNDPSYAKSFLSDLKKLAVQNAYGDEWLELFS